MGHTLGTAAKATGLSRTAILRAIKTNKISAQKNALGEWDIDPAELHRVYPSKTDETVTYNSNLKNGNLALKNSEMQARLEAAEQRIRDKDGVIDDLRRRLDQSEQERRDKDRQLTALLTDQRTQQEPAPPKRRWRLFGGRG
jgi:septal ring factor EnvC (AmiA/AmiB activator)